MTIETNDWRAKAAKVGHGISGWSLIAPAEILRSASRLDRKTLAWGAIALAAVLMLSINLLSSLLFKNAKADLTADHLFTISSGTKSVLSKMGEPINMRVYYTRKLGEVAPLYGKYFERVKALLEQYRDLSNGKLQLTFVEPEAFSDAEDRAVAGGLRGVRLNQDGETGYFGLVATNTTDNETAIEFFSPDRERFLEYDLTKLINGLANPKKRVVGLIAGIPIDGGAPNPMAPMRQPPPAWVVMDQIREFFEVKALQPDLKSIPADIDVLMLVQPQGLTADAAYAIDQFALKGGRILAFVDPVPETSPSPAMGMGMQMPSPGPDAELVKLLKTWGVGIDPSKVAGDPSLARRVQFGGGRRPTVTDYLGWLQIDKAQINDKDVLASSIERLHLASAGVLTKADGATTTVTPIIETTAKGGTLEADKLRFQPDPIALMRDFKSSGALMLAARVSGEAKTAFPDGPPKAPEAKPEDSAKDAAKDGAQPAADAAKAEAPKADAAAKSADAAAKPAEPAKPEVMSGKVNIVVVADSDMLNDQFWVEVRDFMGQQIAVPQAHNAAFVVNALENLSGGEALAGLRGRGINDRPFERVSEIRRDAERRFREKEQTLVAQLKDLQEKVSTMETKGGEGGAILLSDKDKQTIETARTEMIGVRRELRDVKLALRQDIDSLGGWLKFFNVAFIPLVIGLGGLAIGLAQRQRNAK
jgi:ABC-type uncharacterized transport system involved in gliding motility auxiliary subunit